MPTQSPPPLPLGQLAGSSTQGDVQGEWKVTLIFSSEKFGWTESYYSTNPSLQTTLANADALARARAGILGAGVTIDWKRVSSITNWRDFGIIPYAPPLVAFFTANPTDYPTNALLMLLGAGSAAPGIYRGRIFLRGIPDVLADATQKNYYNPNNLAGWNGQLTAFQQQLVSGNWGLYVENRFQQTGNPEVQVMSASQVQDAQGRPTNDAQLILNAAPPATWRPNSGYVLMRGWRGNILNLRGGPNRGPYQIVSVGTTGGMPSAVIHDCQVLTPNPVALLARALVRQVFPITYVATERITERRTGRPLGLVRGRAFPRRP